MQLSELPVVGTGSVQPDWSGGGTGPAGSEASPPVGRVLRWGVPGLRIRRRKPRWPPTRGHRRPCCEAEQRRVRGPLHRRQLAAPRLRQPGLQGRRRRV